MDLFQEVTFMYNACDVAVRIKEISKQKNILLKDMLDACELNKNALSSMLSGGSMPKSENLAKIADYLDCSVDYLLGRIETVEFPKNLDSQSAVANEESNLLSMFRALPKEQREDIFDIVFLKYRKHLGQKPDIYSSFPDNNIESA